jgi:hypothetical protein
LLVDRGYQFDSSIVPLPAPALLRLAEPWLARALPWPIFGDQLRWPASPLGPYRLDLAQPWRRGPSRLWEIPGGAAGFFPVPLNFTLHRMIGDRWAPWLGRLASLVPAPLVLVFHGLDLVDRSRIAVPGFKKPGLADPLSEKTERVRRTIETIGRGRIFLPLREVAQGLNDGTLV